jgi:hypothetical protein
MALSWLALAYQMPAHPSNGRVKIWRRLQQLGAVPVKNAVHLLPDSAQAREDFEWLRTEVAAAGGQATIFQVASMTDEQAAVDAFKAVKVRQYKSLLKEARAMRRTSKGNSQPDGRRLTAVRALQERLDRVSEHDFFDSGGRGEVEAVLQQLAAGPRPDFSKPSRDPAASNIDIDSYKHRVWITRPRPGVDRFASAWLIRRFIDRDATFVFAADPARHPDAVPFDMYVDAGFRHEGDLCTFEVIQKRFGIRETAVTRIAEIVHDVDLKEDRYKSNDAPTVRRVVEGLRAATPDDGKLLEQGIVFFEALYQSYLDSAPRTRPGRVVN